MLIVKVKKFGVDWYIPYEMAADSAKGGFVRTPPPALIGLKKLRKEYRENRGNENSWIPSLSWGTALQYKQPEQGRLLPT